MKNQIESTLSSVQPTEQTLTQMEARFMSHTYGWMFLGLLVTGITSFAVASSQSAVQLIVGNQFLFYGLIIAELALVFALSSAINRLSAITATLLFLFYSALNGLTFSVIFLAYSLPSIGNTFLISAGMFGGLSIYGTVTRRNLSGLGTFMAMGLWGLILTGVVNLFIKSEAINFGLGVVGVLVFSGLAAYDTQKIRSLARTYGSQSVTDAVREKGAIFGALTLYLDFINLFLSLLRILGNRRN